jgi:hypothetical protein
MRARYKRWPRGIRRAAEVQLLLDLVVPTRSHDEATLSNARATVPQLVGRSVSVRRPSEFRCAPQCVACHFGSAAASTESSQRSKWLKTLEELRAGKASGPRPPYRILSGLPFEAIDGEVVGGGEVDGGWGGTRRAAGLEGDRRGRGGHGGAARQRIDEGQLLLARVVEPQRPSRLLEMVAGEAGQDVREACSLRGGDRVDKLVSHAAVGNGQLTLVGGGEKFVTRELGEDVALGGPRLSRVSSPRPK